MSAKKQTQITTAPYLWAMVVLFVISLYVLFEMVPRHVKIYAYLGAALPYPTQLYFVLYSSLKTSPFILPIILVTGCIAIALVGTIIRNKAIVVMVYGSTAFLLLAFVTVGILSMKLPLKAISEIMGRPITVEEIEREMK